jgi:hypothetical protein
VSFVLEVYEGLMGWNFGVRVERERGEGEELEDLNEAGFY